MSSPSGKFWGVDAWLTTVFPLNSDGSLKAVDENVYEGIEIDGPRSFDLTPAEPGTVVNIGNGRVRDTIYRAPREASRAELRVGYDQLSVIASLTGVTVYTVGEALAIGRLTNRQGSEVDAGLVALQRGHDENGLTRFKAYIIPKGKISPIDSSMNDNASEMRYPVTISNSRKELWGVSYVVGTHGFTDVGYLEMQAENPIKVVAWLADGIVDTFSLPTAKPAVSTGKFSVFNFNTGSEITTGITKTVTQFELAYTPAADVLYVGVYEYAE